MITDPGLLPIRGKPAINWCIDAAKKNGAGDIKIVLRSSNTRLSRFLGYSYPDVRQIFVGGDDDAATALVSMLGSCNDDMPTQIILGDTLINEPFPEEADVFLASPNIKTSKQWCLATKDENGHLLRIYNKERDISVTGKEALAGYYKFSDTRLLKRLVFEELRAEQPSIINVFLNYNRQVPILIKTTRNWFDFGHISGAVQARLGLFSAREFNNLAVDAVRGTITKISKRSRSCWTRRTGTKACLKRFRAMRRGCLTSAKTASLRGWRWNFTAMRIWQKPLFTAPTTWKTGTTSSRRC